jgi:hypothetical protein
MLIAQEKKNSNVVEYILYMWQVEDLIRGYGFDINKIQRNIINQYQQPLSVKSQIRQWYESLIALMINEKVQEKGHMQFIKNIVADLSDLHLFILQSPEEYKYNKIYKEALPFIQEFYFHTDGKIDNEVEVCLNALYGLLVMRLKKQEVKPETIEAMKTFSQLLALLAKKYLDRENETFNFLNN